MVKGASQYSPICKAVKYIPKKAVRDRACVASFIFFSRRLWWAHVTVTPEAKRTAVFRRGTENGLIGVIPVGGHLHPISGVGARLLWKKAQKKAKKNITSDVMNRIIPRRRPDSTRDVWCPRKVASRIISRHQRIIVRPVINRPKVRQVVPYP